MARSTIGIGVRALRVRDWSEHAACSTHQCVMTMLSFPLRMSCFPAAPAILASSDCAKVSVTNGRCDAADTGVGSVDGSLDA